MPGWGWGLAVSAGLDTLQCARSLYTPHCRQESHSPGTAALPACSNNPHSPGVRRGERDQPPPPCPPVRSRLLPPGESPSVLGQPRPPLPAPGETTSNIGSDLTIMSQYPHLSTSSPTINLHCSDRLHSVMTVTTQLENTTHYNTDKMTHSY